MFSNTSKAHSVCTVLLLLLAMVTTHTVTSSESCNYDNAHTVANCSFANLSSVPYKIHKNIQTLDLSGNNFSVLRHRSFKGFLYIIHLYMKNSSLSSIESMAFEDMNYLSVLDLSRNLLSHIPTAALDVVARSLTQLFLSGNRIQVIKKDTFKKLNKLQILDLNGNTITHIDAGGLNGLTTLNILKLRHNALHTLLPETFNDFSQSIKNIQLFDNRWMCDCNLRWLRTWLNDTDQEIWKYDGYYIRCDGPAIVKDKALDALHIDDLACEVTMKSSGSKEVVKPGDNTTLVCKYTSVPEADAKWLKNTYVIDAFKDPGKYNISTSTSSRHGELIHISNLKIFNFQYGDIAKYQCFVQNILGSRKTEYIVTFEGMHYDEVTPGPPDSYQSGPGGVDTKSIVIAVAVVCSIILIIVIGVLIFCTVNRMQRKKMDKQNQIAENLKQHFLKNSEMSNGDIAGPNDIKLSNKTAEDKIDGNPEDNHSMSNNTNDSNLTAVKRPLDLDDTEPLYIFEQPGSPFNNGNTYVSFGSELTDPGEMMPPQPPQYSYNTTPRYESSHAGSATPLLDRYTPSGYDSSEPDYAQYPVYDSVTKSLYHPSSGAESIYNGGSLRMGSTSSYASTPNRDVTKRVSSFHYPPANNGPTRTIGSTRSIVALMPKYADQNGDSSPRSDLQRHIPYQNDYRDYRDMRYPTTTPPPHRMTHATPKSMSVGNLGFSPISTGPRKPPRMFQSREYMELTPQESQVDYITSPEAQQYCQNYGITPGTPV